MSEAVTVFTDGAARSNPGPAAWAFVVRFANGAEEDHKGTLGTATNNVAEYTALLKALEHVAGLKVKRVEVHSDSELMVKQMRGEYRVKNPELQDLYREAKDLERNFDRVTYTHVRREQNSRADKLCNEALDGDVGGRPAASAKKKAPAASADKQEAVRADALACLRGVEKAWQQRDGRAPSVEQVWDQLWSILEEHGVVRAAK